jgi:hypothetical protein
MRLTTLAGKIKGGNIPQCSLNGIMRKKSGN